MRKINLLIILIILIFTTVSPRPVKAASLVVTKTADTDDGICDADCSLREAVDVAANKDVITFAPSLSGQTIFLNSHIEIKKGITINGSSLASHVKIDGNNVNFIFFIPFCPECTDAVAGEPVKLMSLDIQNSNSSPAAIENRRNMEIHNVNFIGNKNTSLGGGAIRNSGTMIITNSTFVNNQALTDRGGAIHNRRYMVIESSVFLNNEAYSGGGAIYSEGKLDVYDTLFEGNIASGGGALFTRFGITGAYANIVRSTFYSNTANWSGGGIMNEGQGAILKVSNSTFSSNIAVSNGGAIMNEGYDPFLEVVNSTFSNNSNVSTSATIDSRGDSGNTPPFTPTVSLINTIIANSIGGVDCYIQDTTVIENTNNIIENNGAGANSCGTPFSTSDPMLTPLADNGGLTPTHFLLPSSPAINTGNNSKCSASPISNTSQNGITRPVGGTCDIGAVEMPVITTPSIISIFGSDNNPTNATSINYQVTFSESVTGVDISDFSLTTSGVTGASINNVSGSGSSYTVAVNTGSGDGTIRLDMIDDDTILSSFIMPLGGVGTGNGNFTSGEVYTIDKTPPTVISITRVGTNPSAMLSVSYTVTFSEAVTGVDITDFALTTSGVAGAFVNNVSRSGNTRVVSVSTGQGSGTIELTFISDNTVKDIATNSTNSNYIDGEEYTITKPQLKAPVLRSPRSGGALNDTTPNFIWQRVTGAQSYEIQIDNNNDFSSIEDNSNGIASTNYTSIPLPEGTYYWRVRGNDISGNPGKWSLVRTIIIDTTGPDAPTLISPSGTTSTRTITFRWQPSSGAVMYQFAYDNDEDCQSPISIVTLRGTSRRATLSSGTYYWCVRAKDSLGNWGLWSTPNAINIP